MVEKINNLNFALEKLKIKASCIDYYQLYKCNCYELRLESTTTVKQIEKFSKEIALAIKEESAPKVSLILEKGVVRLDFMKNIQDNINLYDYLNNKQMINDQVCPAFLGKSIYGEEICLELLENPHLLISGCTGSGKSVALHNIICNILNFTESQLFLIDPKMIEFSHYEKIKNVKVIYSYQESVKLLEDLISLMENRFNILKYGCNSSYIKPVFLVIDEFSDLSLQDSNKEFYNKLCKLAQKCRAAKISIILSTQRPSAKLLDGNIKANFPARLSCKVASAIDSKIILDEKGAEELSGRGDAILKCYKYDKVRFQIAYANPEQTVKNLCHGN